MSFGGIRVLVELLFINRRSATMRGWRRRIYAMHMAEVIEHGAPIVTLKLAIIHAALELARIVDVVKVSCQ